MPSWGPQETGRESREGCSGYLHTNPADKTARRARGVATKTGVGPVSSGSLGALTAWEQRAGRRAPGARPGKSWGNVGQPASGWLGWMCS